MVDQGKRRVPNRLAGRQWHQLPVPKMPMPAQLAALPLHLGTLIRIRRQLREENLYEVPLEADPTAPAKPVEPPEEALRARTPDGRWNDLSDPDMGSAGTPFGRNVPPRLTKPNTRIMMDPNPRDISNLLLARDTFKPAHIINALAAAWLQFENHNWFFHGTGDPDDCIEIPLSEQDDWPERPMKIRRTPRHPCSHMKTDRAPAYVNEETHWWDASQLYGTGAAKQNSIRSYVDGKIKVQDDSRLLPHDELPGVDLTGMTENWWTGVAMLHTLFSREHNAICDAIKKEHPEFSDQRLFEVAWLTNAALIAKIHTVEWTPTVLRHPALQVGMRANWWGLAGETVGRTFGRFSDRDVVCGIVGSPPSHHGVPFSLTEEFVSVYRMHPLIPDDWSFFDLESGRLVEKVSFTEIQGEATRAFMDKYSMPDLYYSFGLANAGRVCLHNYPNALRRLTRIDGQLTDLATLDITRDRERGVPRYNDLREALGMPRARTFAELTPNRKWAAEIDRLYKGDVDLVDTMVGMYAEEPPLGFGFSDTAFRIFILMASRRLQSDRFFTSHFTPEVYTKTGFDWVQKTTMKEILLRHHPELETALEHVELPFAPWPVSSTGGGGGLVPDRLKAGVKALNLLKTVARAPLDDTREPPLFAPQPKFP
ncbi:peroxidase family protein [Amycolatopsis sp. NBC_01480]|uniref:peroxidase family protein n=1 Tax=Amycolatopsis sp. NBC_01480 TaxID=2903562 RepID=UPI002E28240E|nr:peroxidase family protein [Amycolatopsis sp. NBC_01480]